MTTLNRKTWLRFIFAALISLAIWFKFTYPQFSFINLSVDRPAALQIAKEFLGDERKIDLTPYQSASIFIGARTPDQYLQKALGFREELKFFNEHDYELFFWSIRFFQENEREEYRVTVSAATGEITGFSHTIEASAFRPYQDEETARQKAITFLKNKFGFDPGDYLPNSNNAQKYDNRTNYSFAWEKKDVFVRWSDEEDSGGAKLLSGATVSGDEILAFNKTRLQIPTQYHRFMSRQMTVGNNIGILFRYIFFALLTASIFYVVVRRNDLVMHTVKKFCIILTAILFLAQLLTHFNIFENILFQYPTTSSFASYLWQYFIGNLLGIFIVTISILMPCLAGESLHYEAFPEKREGSFLHYIISTIFSRGVFRAVLLGYLVAVIMFGIQAAAFEFGQRYLGVWIEYTWMAQLSACYLPFLAALILGISASFTEEIAFRLFSISFGKKFLKNTFLAVLISSILWGFGHGTYPVFPMWFRSLEVTCLGIFLSFIYLRFGIIPVLVAHFLFDVFWSSAAYLLGQSTPLHFYSALIVLLLPLGFGLVVFLMNKSEIERPLRWRLNIHQIYNLEILKNFLRDKIFIEKKTNEELTKEIVSHGWDMAVVEIATDDLFNENKNRKK